MKSDSALPRVLLLTGVSPGRGRVGREYLRAACRLLPPERLSVFSFDPEGAQTAVPELSEMLTHLEPVPDERGEAVDSRLAWMRHLRERDIERHDIPPLIEKIVRFGRYGKVDKLWVPLHTPTMIRLAKPVAEALDVPLIVTVWDPPGYKLRSFGLGRRMRRVLMKKFDATLRHATACGTASDTMRDLYRRLYSTEAVTMILGSPRPRELDDPSEEGPFRIGFVGALYARKEFDAFRRALDDMGWQFEGREIRLELFGDHSGLAREMPDRVRSHGWKEPPDTVRGLSCCHLAYLPYWFDRRRREVVEVSFPGKLATYAAARTPVMFHGPPYASPVRFLERFRFGRVCATLNPGAIAPAIVAAIRDEGWRRSAREACDDAHTAELSADVFRRRFAALLDVPEDHLLC